MASGTGDETPAIPAATVILLRDAGDGIETLMLRRNSKLAFGGMWVFPGGRVDPADRDERRRRLRRRAAGRGARGRGGMRARRPDRRARRGLALDPAAGHAEAVLDVVLRRRAAPEGAVTIDDGEIHEHMWVSPQGAIDQRDAGVIELAPPTWVTLHTLAQAADTADALARAGGRSSRSVFVTQHRQDRRRARRPLDRRPRVRDRRATPTPPGPRHRLVMAETTWRYERTDT